MNDLSKLSAGIDALLSNIQLSDDIKEEEVDWEQVEWYRQRFELFKEDGCAKANVAYTEHAKQNKKLNHATRMRILLMATRM